MIPHTKVNFIFFSWQENGALEWCIWVEKELFTLNAVMTSFQERYVAEVLSAWTFPGIKVFLYSELNLINKYDKEN